MKFPIHALRRKSVVPNTMDLPAPVSSPPPGASSRDSTQAPAYTAEGGITTARPLSSSEAVQINMKQMVQEDWVSAKHFLRHMKWKVVLRACVRRYLWKWYAIAAVAIVLTVLITTQHDAVVKYCAPVAHTIRSWPAGWLIPIALLIIVSYPPLVGHEIIGLLVGLVWGMGQGFAILAAGTFLGEILLWFSFKWCCTNAASKFEKKNRLYWSLTQLIREKTFMFVLILRFSAIPGHIVTAVSASAGANYWSYLAAAFLTLPKQFVIVYLGEAFGHKETKHQIISTATLLLTVVVTGIAAIYVYYQMRLVWKRRDLELPTALGVPMVENPTWADVVEADEKMNGTSLVEVKNADNTVITLGDEKTFLPQLSKDDSHAGIISRKPWLNESPNHKSMRGWSVPHHMTESEMREFQQDMESSQPTTQGVSSTQPLPRFSASFDMSRTGSNNTPLTASSTTFSTHHDVAPDTLSPYANMPPSASSTGSGSRYTNSMDLARPDSAAGFIQPPAAGRATADEADNYAYARGGRTPDYSRLRGESRAALLGRPKADEK